MNHVNNDQDAGFAKSHYGGPGLDFVIGCFTAGKSVTKYVSGDEVSECVNPFIGTNTLLRHY